MSEQEYGRQEYYPEEQEFGGQEFGGQEFGGQEFGGQEFGGQEYDDFGNDFGNDIEYKQEIVAFERAGPSNKLDEMLLGPEMVTKKGREIYNAEQKFLINVNMFSRKIMDEDRKLISQNDIDTMLEATQGVKGLKYKNYAAYVLGYIVTSGGVSRVIKVENVKNISKTLDHAKRELGVYPEDVIRYARLWMNLRASQKS